jgi:gluconate 5-dehydrogenase
MPNLFDLEGRIAVVTGASSGLGADAAVAYAAYGADVALLARRFEKLQETAKKVEALGKRALPIVCDVGDEENVKAAIEEVIATFGKIDILLNNAGITSRGGVDELKLENWDRVVATNMTGIFLMSKYVIPHMKERHYGKVINVASVNALIADKYPLLSRHAYNATKSGVRGLTMGMAASYGLDNITVNSVSPGLFETEMTKDTLFKFEPLVKTYNALSPFGRPGDHGELNGTIIYLSSEASSYVSGQHIVVDGCYSIV